MNIQRLVSLINEELDETQYTVTDTEITKNGISYIGLKVHYEDINLSPVIYLDKKDERVDEETLAKRYALYIVDYMSKFRKPECFKGLDITDKETFLSKVTFTIEDVTHELYFREKKAVYFHDYDLDVIVIARYIVSDEDFGMSSIVINEDLLKSLPFEIQEFEIISAGKDNLNRDYTIIPMGRFLFAEMDLPFPDIDDGLYILTRKSHTNGASMLLSSEAMQEIHGLLGKDIYILPSSIHEVICLKSDGKEETLDYLMKMVEEVNNTVVAEEDLLKNCVWERRQIDRHLACISTYFI